MSKKVLSINVMHVVIRFRLKTWNLPSIKKEFLAHVVLINYLKKHAFELSSDSAKLKLQQKAINHILDVLLILLENSTKILQSWVYLS